MIRTTFASKQSRRIICALFHRKTKVLMRLIARAYARRSGMIALLFFLWAAWLSAEYGVLGPNSYVRLHNTGDIDLPRLIALPMNASGGQLGYWAPQGACGNDRGAQQGGTNDIRAIPFLLLPGWLAYALFTLMQRFVAGYFMFRLVRDELVVSFWPAIYAALGYALFAQEWWNHAWAGFTVYDGLIVPGFPFSLWALSRIRSGRWRSSAFWAVGAGAFMASTGSLVLSMFLFPLVLFWFAVLAPRRSLGFWAFVALFAAVWGVLAIPVILPSILAAQYSNRMTLSSEIIWGFAVNLLTVFQAIHDNWLALLFAAAGLLVSRSRKSIALFAAMGFCYTVQVFYSSVAKALRHYLPLLSGFSGDRIMLVVPFLAFAAGALGIEQLGRGWELTLERSSSQRFQFRAATVLALLAVALTVWDSGRVKLRTIHDLADRENYGALYRNPDLEQLARLNSGAPPFRVATIAVGDVLPLYPPGAAWAYGMESADGFLNIQFQRYQRFWEQVIAPLLDVEASRYAYVHFWGAQLYLFAPTNPPSPGTELDFDKYYRLNLLSLANVRYIISPIPISEARLSLLPSSHREAQLSWTRQGGFRRMAAILRGHNLGIPLYIYENRDALPRFFLAGGVRVSDDSTQLLELMSAADLHELLSTVFVERRDAGQLSLQRLRSGTGTVSVRRYEADRIDLETEATSPTILVATNSFSPFWKAWVDGHPVRLMPVDNTFQGVFIEEGGHSVTLRYDPPYALP
jgi:hypothetical protein